MTPTALAIHEDIKVAAALFLGDENMKSKNTEKLKAYDVEVTAVTAQIKVLEERRSAIWKERAALVCECMED